MPARAEQLADGQPVGAAKRSPALLSLSAHSAEQGTRAAYARAWRRLPPSRARASGRFRRAARHLEQHLGAVASPKTAPGSGLQAAGAPRARGSLRRSDRSVTLASSHSGVRAQHRSRARPAAGGLGRRAPPRRDGRTAARGGPRAARPPRSDRRAARGRRDERLALRRSDAAVEIAVAEHHAADAHVPSSNAIAPVETRGHRTRERAQAAARTRASTGMSGSAPRSGAGDVEESGVRRRKRPATAGKRPATAAPVGGPRPAPGDGRRWAARRVEDASRPAPRRRTAAAFDGATLRLGRESSGGSSGSRAVVARVLSGWDGSGRPGGDVGASFPKSAAEGAEGAGGSGVGAGASARDGGVAAPVVSWRPMRLARSARCRPSGCRACRATRCRSRRPPFQRRCRRRRRRRRTGSARRARRVRRRASTASTSASGERRSEGIATGTLARALRDALLGASEQAARAPGSCARAAPPSDRLRHHRCPRARASRLRRCSTALPGWTASCPHGGATTQGTTPRRELASQGRRRRRLGGGGAPLKRASPAELAALVTVRPARGSDEARRERASCRASRSTSWRARRSDDLLRPCRRAASAFTGRGRTRPCSPWFRCVGAAFRAALCLPGSASEHDFDALARPARRDLHALDRSPACPAHVRVEHHDGRVLHRDAPRDKTERNVHDPVAARAQRGAQALRLGGGVAHEHQGSAPARPPVPSGAGLGVGAHHLVTLQRSPSTWVSLPRMAPWSEPVSAVACRASASCSDRPLLAPIACAPPTHPCGRPEAAPKESP